MCCPEEFGCGRSFVIFVWYSWANSEDHRAPWKSQNPDVTIVSVPISSPLWWDQTTLFECLRFASSHYFSKSSNWACPSPHLSLLFCHFQFGYSSFWSFASSFWLHLLILWFEAQNRIEDLKMRKMIRTSESSEILTTPFWPRFLLLC